MNFNHKFNTYNENAIVQKKLAQDLLDILKKHNSNSYNSVLEIGCGTGIFTQLFLDTYKPSTIILNDIYNSKAHLDGIYYTEFLQGNIEEISIPDTDIIVSSSVFQWINDFENLIYKLSTHSKNLAFSLYIQDNLYEITNHFNVSLKYLSHDDILFILKKYYTCIHSQEYEYKLNFNTPIEALKHLKNTGVTGFATTSSVKKIKSFPDTTLTYKGACFFATKN